MGDFYPLRTAKVKMSEDFSYLLGDYHMGVKNVPGFADCPLFGDDPALNMDNTLQRAKSVRVIAGQKRSRNCV